MKALAISVKINNDVENEIRNCSKTVREFESASVESIMNMMETIVAMEKLISRDYEISKMLNDVIGMSLNRASAVAQGVRGIPPEKVVRDLCLGDVQHLAGWQVNVAAATDVLVHVSAMLSDGYAQATAAFVEKRERIVVGEPAKQDFLTSEDLY